MACTVVCRLVAKLGGLRRGLLVNRHEAQVVVGDLVRCLLALEAAVEEALQRVPPNRAADREADVAVDRRAGAQPLVDLLGRGAAPQNDADHAVAPAGAGLRDETLPLGGI